MSEMAALLTCENLRDELHTFARETLQRFLDEICERIRRELRTELEGFVNNGVQVVRPSTTKFAFKLPETDSDDASDTSSTQDSPTVAEKDKGGNDCRGHFRPSLFFNSALAEKQMKALEERIKKGDTGPEPSLRDLPTDLAQTLQKWRRRKSQVADPALLERSISERPTSTRVVDAVAWRGRSSSPSIFRERSRPEMPAPSTVGRSSSEGRSVRQTLPRPWRITSNTRRVHVEPEQEEHVPRVSGVSLADLDGLRMLATAAPGELAYDSPRHAFHLPPDRPWELDPRTSMGMAHADGFPFVNKSGTAATAALAAARAATAVASASVAPAVGPGAPPPGHLVSQGRRTSTRISSGVGTSLTLLEQQDLWGRRASAGDSHQWESLNRVSEVTDGVDSVVAPSKHKTVRFGFFNTNVQPSWLHTNFSHVGHVDTPTSEDTPDFERSDCEGYTDGKSFAGACASFVKSLTFDCVSAALIILNAISIGWQTDYMARNVLSEAPQEFQIVEIIFCMAFALELLLRLCVYRLRFFTTDGWKWNVFDCALVIFQMGELVFQMIGQTQVGTWGIMKAVRIVRLLRVMRVLRVLRFLRDMRTLIISVATSIKPLGWSVVMLLLMLYVIAVYFTEVVLDHRVHLPAVQSDDDAIATNTLIHHFGNLGSSIFSLYQVITGGMDWRDVSDPLMASIGAYMGVVFAFYIAFAVICMVNLFTGIFVQTALQHAEYEKQLETVNSLRDILIRGVGLEKQAVPHVSADDFVAHLADPEMKRYLKEIDVDVTSAHGLFRLLDPDDQGVIPVSQVLTGCVRLRGPAKSIDLASLTWEVRNMQRINADHRRSVERSLRDLTKILSDLLGPPAADPTFNAGESSTPPFLFGDASCGCVDCGGSSHLFGCHHRPPSSCSSC